MRMMGAAEHDIAEVRAAMQQSKDAAEAANTVEIFQENVESWRFFADVCTQWSYAGMAGVRTGIDYAGARAHLEMTRRRRMRRTLWSDLRIMEQAVLQADSELRKH